MYEVDFSGWTRTPEDLKKIKTNPMFRRNMHLKRFIRAITSRRYWFFNWYNIRGLIFNETDQFR